MLELEKMMRYEIQESSTGCVELRLDGDLVLGPDGAKVRECLSALVRRFPQVTVDLSRLRRIDSAGIGILVAAHAEAGKNGNLLRAVNVVGSVRDLLLLVKLLTIFDGSSENQKAA